MAAPSKRLSLRLTARQVLERLSDFGDIPSGSDDDRLSSGPSDDDEDYNYIGSDEKGDDDVEENGDEGSENGDGNVSSDSDKEQVVPRKKSKTKNRKVWEWVEADLPETGELPENLLRLKGPALDATCEIEYFMELFGKDTFALLVMESNRLKYQEKKDHVKPVTEDEMRKLFGIIIYMSVVHLPCRRDYWAQQTRQDIVAETMTVNRFEQILSFLHVNDNELQTERDQPGYDRLYKVRTLIDIVSENFKKCAEPEQHMSVDEQIIPFKGHHGLKTYMKNKPTKWGYKLWGLAGQSGYFHKFQIQGDNCLSERLEEPGIGKSGQVVLDLTKDLPHGTHIYFDNYFASPELLLELKKRGFDATCTMRQNRRGACPLKTEKELKRLERGSFDYKSSDGIVICVWYDNRVVTVASNKCSVLPAHKVRRYNRKQKEYVDVNCPGLIKAYNKSMGGVDKCDMMLALYRIHMKSKKWYKRIIFHCVDLCIVNAWALQKAATGIRPQLYKLKLEVARGLIQGVAIPQPQHREPLQVDMRSARNVPNNIKHDGVGHLPRQLAEVPKRCKNPGCSRRTKHMCLKCKVYLCVDKYSDCFFKYHTKE